MNPLRGFAQAIAPLHRRVMLMIARGAMRLADDDPGVQRVQVSLLAGETRADVERIQEYGFSGHPHPGAEAIVVFVGGNRDHPIAVAVDDRRHRLRGLAPGEVAVYSDEGDSIVLRRGRLIEVTTETLLVKAGTKVRIETPQLEVTGEITDRVDAGGRSMSGMRDIYNRHRHPENDNGGPTGTPQEDM